MSDEFNYVCNFSELEENKGHHFLIDDVDIALFRIENKIYALNNVCPHHHANVMANGFIEKNYICCPNHGWRFDFKTGLKEGKLKGLDKYEVKLEDDKVFVKVFKKELNW